MAVPEPMGSALPPNPHRGRLHPSSTRITKEQASIAACEAWSRFLQGYDSHRNETAQLNEFWSVFEPFQPTENAHSE